MLPFMRSPVSSFHRLVRTVAAVAVCLAVTIGGALPVTATSEPALGVHSFEGVIGSDDETIGFIDLPAPNVPANCATAYAPFSAPQSCTLFSGLFSGPPGDFVLREASVRTGATTGPMQFVIIRAFRSRANGGGPIVCCFAQDVSQIFTPAPNQTTTIPVSLPIANRIDVIDGEQIEVVDRLAISVLSGQSVLPLVAAPSPNTTSIFAPHFQAGGERLLSGTPQGQAIPTISGVACAADGSSTEPVCRAVNPPGPTTPPGTSFTGVTPSRQLDTRSTGRVSAGSTTRIRIGGVGGIPTNAAGAVLNVTAVAPSNDGFLTVFPCGQTQPGASNVNFRAGQNVANAAVATLGEGGEVCVFSSAETNLLVDVSGAVTSGFAGFNPSRLLDTRGSSKVAPGSTTRVRIAGAAGVPAETIAAVLNVTAVGPSAKGFLTVYPCGETQPGSSNVNFEAQQTVPNAVVATLGSAGEVCVFSSVETNLLVDLNGAVTAGFGGLVPSRLLDTRGSGRVAAGSTTRVRIAGVTGVPASAVAGVLNVTAVAPSEQGFLTVFPCGGAQPGSSNVNFAPGQTVANAAVATLGAGGEVCVFSSVETNLLVDLNGAFT